MPWTQTTLTLKDAAGNNQPLIAYTDGTNYSLAHPLLDATGAIVAPANAGNQAAGNSSLTTIVTNTANIPAKGTATSANSVPVVIASDQSALPLPTGAATSGKQDTQITALAAIQTLVGNIPGSPSTAALQTTGNTSVGSVDTNLGAKADAAAGTDTGTFSLISLFKRSLQTLTTISGAVATAANQSTGNTSLATIATNTTGAATAANQTTGNTSLASIVTNTTGVATATNQSTQNTALGAPADAAVTNPASSGSIIAFLKGILTGVNAATPAGTNLIGSVVPTMASGGHTSATTAATGTNWTAFASQALKQLTISNQTGVTLEFRQGAAGVGLQVPTSGFYTFFGLTNANQIDVRRVDTSNTQVTVTARWES